MKTLIDFENYDCAELANEIVEYIKKKDVKKVLIKISEIGPDHNDINKEIKYSLEEYDTLKKFLEEFLRDDLDQKHLTLNIPEIKTMFKTNVLGELDAESEQEDFKEVFRKYE